MGSKNGRAITEAMTADVDNSGLSRQQVAAALGLSDDPAKAGEILHKMIRGERRFPLDQIGTWRHVTDGTAFLCELCKQANGLFVALPDVGPGDEAILVRSIKEFSEFAQASSDSRLPDSDGGTCITKQEAERVEREGHEAIAKILALIELTNTEAGRASMPYAESLAKAAEMQAL